MLKRTFDLVVSGIGLIVLAPILILIALVVRLGSRGPAIFRQERVGRGGSVFRIHKFRTMKVNAAQNGPMLTSGADARVTWIGRYLRRHKLDELPQLLDVFTGRMSLVGPRPEVPRYVELYPSEIRAKILSVAPGITDPASLSFMNENEILEHATDPERTYVECVMPRKLALALEYVENRSFLLDLKIIARTLQRIVVP